MIQQVKQNLSPSSERNFFNLSLAFLLIVLYGPILLKWYDGWLNKNISTEHEYFSHGLIGFPYALYVVWQNRKQWQKLPNKSHPLGFIFLGVGAACYLVGSPQELVYLSLPVLLTGICLWLKGMPGLKLQGFPLLLVFLATPNPIPYLLTPYTLGLQKFIAGAAGLILSQLGINVQVEEIYLSVNDRLVEVAPYCAGLKMLFTSLYVALILLHWSHNLGSRTVTSLLLLGAAAISVTANIIRNTLLTWFHGMGQDNNFEILHAGWGGDLYSAFMLLAIVALLKAIERWHLGRELDNLEGDEGEHEQTQR